MYRATHEVVCEQVACWLAAQRKVWLCTIVETWGSSPRPAGSWLAVNEDGDWAGSVSGGCLEQDLLDRCIRENSAAPQVIDYGISNDDRDRFRLPCGGRIRLLVEPLSPDRDEAHMRELLAALSRREPIQREIQLDGHRPALRLAQSKLSGVRLENQLVRHTLVPECRLLLIGAGEVAHYVAEFATAADFTVTLCEPRPEFARGWRNERVRLHSALPDDLINQSFSDAWSGVLALAHDPRVDDMALLAALNTQAFYVGAMGSVTTSEQRRNRLEELGVESSLLEKLRAPIGVDIPSKTPAEIAISVVADLISARHRLRQSYPSL